MHVQYEYSVLTILSLKYNESTRHSKFFKYIFCANFLTLVKSPPHKFSDDTVFMLVRPICSNVPLSILFFVIWSSYRHLFEFKFCVECNDYFVVMICVHVCYFTFILDQCAFALPCVSSYSFIFALMSLYCLCLFE